jgi:hypothetical protein
MFLNTLRQTGHLGQTVDAAGMCRPTAPPAEVLPLPIVVTYVIID